MGGRGRSAGDEEGRRLIDSGLFPAHLDVRQTDKAVAYIEPHAKDEKPFFMDINFIKMHNPNNPAQEFAGKSRLGGYSDSLMEFDPDIGRIMAAIRAKAPNTIVVVTADNGAWRMLIRMPAPLRSAARRDRPSKAAGGCPGIMWWPGHIAAGRPLRRDDVAHRRLGDTCRDGWSDAAAA